MKIGKDTQNAARRLFRLCMDGNAVAEDRVRLIARKIAERKPRNFRLTNPPTCAIFITTEKHRSEKVTQPGRFQRTRHLLRAVGGRCANEPPGAAS